MVFTQKVEIPKRQVSHSKQNLPWHSVTERAAPGG